SVFFPRPPRPPSSPLFPYTTLFRSPFLRLTLYALCIPGNGGKCGGHSGFPLCSCTVQQFGSEIFFNEFSVKLSCFKCRLTHRPLDRKSTRLNSSHVKISYAVFCLKK